MIIQPARVATLPKGGAELAAAIADPERSLFVSSDIAHIAGPAAGQTATPLPGLALTTMRPVADPDGELDRQLRKALTKLGKEALADIGKTVPGAKGPVEGIQACFATYEAIAAFGEPGGTSVVKPLVATAKALSELVDVVDLFAPGFKTNGYVQVATLMVKIGGTVYQVHADVVASETAKPAFGLGLTPGT